MDTVDLPRRLKAARVLADLTVTQLAAKLDTPGFGAKTLGAIERDERAVRPHEVRLLAEALDVPEAFFTAPLSDLAGPPAGDSGAAEAFRHLREIALQNQRLLLAIASGADLIDESAAVQARRDLEPMLQRIEEAAAQGRRASQPEHGARRHAKG